MARGLDSVEPLLREAAEMAQPATVLAEDELRRKRAASIGDTLSQEAGVQSSAFGAGAELARGDELHRSGSDE